MVTLPAGDKVIDLIELAYHTNQPILLSGRHGIGKSSLFEQAAHQLGINIVVRDLSLMEPVDLIGIPQINKNRRTVYCPPSFLPTEGNGLLVFEELNRCHHSVRAPCLQLLTARCLNDYDLQTGWLSCAAINPIDDELNYPVDELDPALISRFLQVCVVADVASWVKWSREPGNVHEAVLEFVEGSTDIFDDPISNPRAWTYASNLLITWESTQQFVDLLTVGLTGLVGETWAASFLEFYGATDARPLLPQQIIDDYIRYRDRVNRWIKDTKLDLISSSLENLKKHLQRQRDYEDVIHNVVSKENVETFFSDLPADLKKIARSWLKDRNYSELKVPGRPQACRSISSEKRKAG